MDINFPGLGPAHIVLDANYTRQIADSTWFTPTEEQVRRTTKERIAKILATRTMTIRIKNAVTLSRREYDLEASITMRADHPPEVYWKTPNYGSNHLTPAARKAAEAYSADAAALATAHYEDLLKAELQGFCASLGNEIKTMSETISRLRIAQALVDEAFAAHATPVEMAEPAFL